MRTRRILRTALVAGLLGTSLVVAACGGSDSSTSSTSNSTATTTPATTAATATADKSPLKVGMIAATKSPVSNPEAVASARAAVKAINDGGGLNGHPLEFVYCNDKNDPNQAATCAREMVSANVIATFGGAAFGGLNAQPILAKANIPEVGILPYSAQELAAKNVFPIGYSPASLIIANAVTAKQKKSINTATLDNPTGHEQTGWMTAAIKKAGGTSGPDTNIPAATADYAPLAASAMKGDPDVLFMELQSVQEVPMIQAIEQSGGIPQYIPAQVDQKLLKAIGPETASKLIGSSPFPDFADTSIPMLKQFRDALAAQEATGDSDASLESVTDFTFNSFLALHAIQEVTKDATDITGSTVMSALLKAKDIDMGGVIPPWTPSNPGPPGLQNISNTATYLFTFKDGKRVPTIEGTIDYDQAVGQ